MRISINGHYLHRRMSGLARYARQIHALLAEDGHQIIEIQPSRWFYRDGGKIRRVLRFFALAMYELLQPRLLLLLRRSDLHISPAFAAPISFRSAKHIVVVHDLAFIDYPNMYSRLERFYLHLNLRVLQLGHHRIVTPSDFIKKQICTIYRISSNRIHTISPYSDFSLRNPSPTEKDKYFVLLSNAHPRKNLEATVSGFLASGACSAGYSLLVIGNFEQAVHTQSDRVKVLKGISDEQLEQILSRATALVLFSLSEGFGFPVVEAASLGVVSLTSGVSSLRELSSPELPVSIATSKLEIAEKFNLFLTSEQFRAKLEKDRIYVTTKFSRQSFNEYWRKLINDQ